MIRSSHLPQQTSDQFRIESDFCRRHGLELERAADFGWIVREPAADHPGQVVGCIDQLRDSVELMRLDGGFCWSGFDCLHDALEDLVLRTLDMRS